MHLGMSLLVLVLFRDDIEDEFHRPSRHVIHEPTSLADLMAIPQDDVSKRVVPFHLYVVYNETVVEVADKFILRGCIESTQISLLALVVRIRIGANPR